MRRPRVLAYISILNVAPGLGTRSVALNHSVVDRRGCPGLFTDPPCSQAPSFTHGAARSPARREALMNTAKRSRAGLFLLVTVVLAASAPGCGKDQRRDGTLAPVLESDRAGLERSAQNYKQNYMKKGAMKTGPRRR